VASCSAVTNGLAIEVDDVDKRYDAGVQALSGVSFSVEEGEIFGYLGRNGAGKSTTVRILTTLSPPSAGRALVCGIDVCSDPSAVRKTIGVALQEAALDDLMTGREHLVLAGRLIGLGKVGSRRRADELLEIFGLGAAADRVSGRYSGGMRRRLDVAMAIVRRPQVLFLDEPTTGVDPQGRRALWAIVRELRDRGSTVFLTTQDMAEAEDVATRIAVIHDGRIVAMGSPDELKVRFGGSPTVQVRSDAANLARIREVVRGRRYSEGDDGWLSLTVDTAEAASPLLLAGLAAAGVSIEHLRFSSPSLEDVFVNLTGTGIDPSDSTISDSLFASRSVWGTGR
jgi:ABC-2 type transport system ATP-binding protein